jgi:hypothetical protein
MSQPQPTAEQRVLLAEALQICRYLVLSAADDREPAVVTRRQQRLRQIQSQIQGYGHEICCDRIPINQIPYSVRQAFVQAVLLVSRYGQTGSSGWRGTLPSPTLEKYRPDSLPDWLQQSSILPQLGKQFQLGETAIATLLSQLDQADQHLTQQSQLIAAVLASVSPQPDQPTQADFARLFQRLFDCPLPADAIHGLYTPTQIYFCLDFAAALGNPALAGPSRQRLQQIQTQIQTFSFDQFRRFPTFGPCRPEQIQSPWLEQLAVELGQSKAAITQALAATVGVLPLAEAEAFLIHDIWGHYWQLGLTQFQSDYATLADCQEPLRAAETAYTEAGPLTYRQLFGLKDDQVTLDLAKARLFFHGEVRQRLGLLFTHLLGEIVADVAEFKFVWSHPQSAANLPSSSVFKHQPTNLDLSLADLDFLFLRVLHPLLSIELSVRHPSPLESDLLADLSPAHGLTPSQALTLEISLKQTILQLHHLFLEEYRTTYLPTLATDGNLFAAIVTNLLQVQTVLNQLYTQPALTQFSAPLPVQDLLLIFITSYCAGDCYHEFWQVDDVLAAYFLPCWRWLASCQPPA